MDPPLRDLVVTLGKELVARDLARLHQTNGGDDEERLATTSETLTKTADTLSKTTSELASVTAERDKLRRAYDLLKGQLELLRRRIFLAKAERLDTSQLELEFAETKAKLDRLAKTLDANATPPRTNSADSGRNAQRGRSHAGDETAQAVPGPGGSDCAPPAPQFDH